MSFYTDFIKKDPRFNSTNICRDVALLEPGFRAKVQALLDKAHADGHDIRIAEAFRSQARQAQLFEQGYTQLKKVGVHNYGLACDFNLFVNGKYETDGQEYSFLLGYGKELKFISGIDWGTPWQKHTFHDWDHIQNVPVFRQTALFSGSWYPDSNYNPIQDTIAHYGTVAQKVYA